MLEVAVPAAVERPLAGGGEEGELWREYQNMPAIADALATTTQSR